jgi:hypothetical protein
MDSLKVSEEITIKQLKKVKDVIKEFTDFNIVNVATAMKKSSTKSTSHSRSSIGFSRGNTLLNFSKPYYKDNKEVDKIIDQYYKELKEI